MPSMPMYFPPSPFNLADAVTCAALTTAAYDMYAQWTAQGRPSHAERFRWTPNGPPLHYGEPIWACVTALVVFRYPEPIGFVAWSDDGSVYLVYRGTKSEVEWVKNLEADQCRYAVVPGYGLVHRGFLSLYESARIASIEAIKRAPSPRRLLVTGHSLGSGLSTLAVPDLIASTASGPGAIPVYHYNFASPHVGNSEFASAYNQSGVPTYRFVNTCDLTPGVPASVVGSVCYEHVGTQVAFTAQYHSIRDNHEMPAICYALDHPDQPQGPPIQHP